MKMHNLGANVTELTLPNAVVLFSYGTPVAAHIGTGFVRTSKKWSVTTTKHINKWIGKAAAAEVPQEYFTELVNARQV